MYKYHRYTDTITHDTIYVFFTLHWYMDTPFHYILSVHIFVSSFPRYSMHSYFMFLLHYYIDSSVYMYWLSMYSCYIDHGLYDCYMDIHVFPLNDYFSLLKLIFPLLDTWAVDMRCVESHINCFLFPVILFYAINRAHVSLSCYRYHATCSFHVVYFKYNKDNLGIGETWRLIRSYRVDVLDPYLSHCRGW